MTDTTQRREELRESVQRIIHEWDEFEQNGYSGSAQRSFIQDRIISFVVEREQAAYRDGAREGFTADQLNTISIMAENEFARMETLPKDRAVTMLMKEYEAIENQADHLLRELEQDTQREEEGNE